MINLKYLKDTFKILKALLDTQVWKCICLLLVMYIFVPYYVYVRIRFDTILSSFKTTSLFCNYFINLIMCDYISAYN